MNNYKRDINRCASNLKLDAGEGLIRCVKFVLATIQQQFHTVPAALSEWDRLGHDAESMWGMKKDGVKHIETHSDRLYGLLSYAIEREDPVDAIDTLLEVPGLGVVKAAFVAQLYGLNVGCLDTHNENLYNTTAQSFYVPSNLSARLRLRRIEAYVTFTQGVGTSEHWWTVWCEFMASKYPQHYDDGEEVSIQHVNCLN
jgi:hypothetical protein